MDYSVTPPLPHRLTPSHNNNNISPSILITVTVLSVTVIVCLLFLFLLRYLNRRCLRRLAVDPDGFPTPIINNNETSPETINPSPIIESLPLFAFSSVSRRHSTATTAATDADCAVCLSKFNNNDQLRLLPLCCHAFHVECIDTWLRSNLSCPLCRSAVFPSDNDLNKIYRTPSSDSHRIEIGNISRRGTNTNTNPEASGDGRSYSIGSFEYYVESPSEVSISFSQDHRRTISDNKDIPIMEESPVRNYETENVVSGGVSGNGHWLKDYVDRLSASISSRTASFRSSGRFFNGGSSRRMNYDIDDVEYNRTGEEISEMFRWLSGV